MSALLDKHAPVLTRTVTVKTKVPWLNGDIKEAKQKRRQLERKWRQTNLTIHRDLFKEQRQEVSRLISSAKSVYYTEKIDECASDYKGLYKVINQLLPKPELRLPCGESAQELANSFSQFFRDKITAIQETLVLPANCAYVPPVVTSVVQKSLNSFTPASTKEVHRLIQRSPTKSCSLDPLPTWLLKDCIEPLLPTITTIINMSMATGVVPQEMKQALVTPLLKKPSLDPEQQKNHRPVSNLSFVSKIEERVVLSRLLDHLSDNDLQEPFQSAYRANHSTETALMRVQNDILMELDDKKAVVLVLLDMSAAFDTVDHALLLTRLSEVGVTGVAHDWFRSYLTNRTQTVCIGHVKSDPCELSCGVPQGSVLGPVLFTLYTAPIGRIIRKHGLDYHFYADDSQLYVSFRVRDTDDQVETLSRINACVQEINAWMAYHLLKLSREKTEVLVITTPQSRNQHSVTEVLVGDCVIRPSSVARNIGVMFDDLQDMNKHVQKLCQTAYFHLHRINSIRDCLNQQAAERLVLSLVTARLDYGNGLLIGLPGQLLDKLQRVQNSAARIVTRTGRYEHITPVLKKLHWLPVRYRIQYKVLLLTFRALHGEAPVYISDLI